MKCYVINLASRPERLAHIDAAFGEAGIPFDRFEAVDQRQVADHPIAQKLPGLRSGRPWQPFEIGCLLSHYEIWKRIAEGEDDFAAIFEDDVVLSDQLGPILEGDFPRDADIVKLETFQQVVYLGREHLSSCNKRVGFRRLLSIHEGTAGYLIGRRAAKLLADVAPTFDEPLDRAMFAPRLARKLSLRMYQSVPAVVIQGMFVPEHCDARTMASDRAPVSDQPERFLGRIAGRLVNQMRGGRTVVPFATRDPIGDGLAF